MFERELQYFKDNQAELVSRYNGQILVLMGDKVVGVYPSALQAYLDASEKYKPGSYMIQKCEPGEDAYTVTLSSALAVPV